VAWRVVVSPRIAISAALAAAGLLVSPWAFAAPHVTGAQTGLGVVGPDTPKVLEKIAQDPYAPAQAATCNELVQQIVAMDDILGPDVDAAPGPPRKKSAGKVAGSTFRALMPYRGVARIFTGADRKDKALGKGVVAGVARRGYLRGLYEARGCQVAALRAATDAVASAPAQDAAAPKAAQTSPGPAPALPRTRSRPEGGSEP